eukprot:sb/3469714/
MFRGFDDDPFFRDFNSSIQSNFGRLGGGDNIFRDMDRLMGDMMGNMPGPSLALEGPRGNRGERPRGNKGGEVANRDRPGFFSFPDMGALQRDLNEMSKDGNVYSHQQVYCYSKKGDEEPKEYQAVSSTATGPGGIKETKKGYKDSSTKTQRMQYGRHIRDRATIQERSQVRDAREEKTDHIGFEESQAGEFDAEWRKKAGGLYRGHERAGRGERANRPAIAHK